MLRQWILTRLPLAALRILDTAPERARVIAFASANSRAARVDLVTCLRQLYWQLTDSRRTSPFFHPLPSVGR